MIFHFAKLSRAGLSQNMPSGTSCKIFYKSPLAGSIYHRGIKIFLEVFALAYFQKGRLSAGAAFCLRPSSAALSMGQASLTRCSHLHEQFLCSSRHRLHTFIYRLSGIAIKNIKCVQLNCVALRTLFRPH